MFKNENKYVKRKENLNTKRLKKKTRKIQTRTKKENANEKKSKKLGVGECRA